MNKKLILFIFIIILFLFFILSKRNPQNKILLIGIDGADWKVINLLLKEDKLPTFKKLIQKGSWGNLQSFFPLASETIWTSIFTGKSPDKHGITAQLMKDPDTQELVPPTSNLIKTKKLWNILSEFKRKVGVIGHRVTWPPRRNQWCVYRYL